MPTLSIAREDYLKAIYGLSSTGTEVTNVALSRELNVTTASVSAMVKRLVTDEMLQRIGTRRLRLTPNGERAAVRVIRRRRLLETFLVQVLDVPWDDLNHDVESLEHAISDRLTDRLDAVLGHPTRDPHGDPIPSADGRHDESWGEALDSATAGSQFLVERIRDDDGPALRHLATIGVLPGTVVEVDGFDPFGGPLHVRIAANAHSLAPGLTRSIFGRTVGRPHVAGQQ